MNSEPHILIVVDQPSEGNHPAWKVLRPILDGLKQILQSKKNGEQLTEYVWQFPMPSALRIAIDFQTKLQEHQINHTMFYCASKIEECKKF
jgi:hypothetical protein